MKKQRPSTRSDRHAKNPATVPTRFEPRFWETTDQRQAVVKEIRRRCETLREDTGADSAQKNMLVQRAIFMSIQLETMEVEAIESGKFDPGIYTQMSNALLGLLRQLGLERKIKTTVDLKAYVSGGRT
jgi:hypothetical protein